MARGRVPGAPARHGRRGRALRGAALILAALAVALLAVAPPTVRLAGFLPFDEATRRAWYVSGAWLWPVGDPLAWGAPDPEGFPGYQVLRGLERGDAPHLGADLGDGRAGGLVRAAAHGLVVRVLAKHWTNGYGRHVVIAHRLAQGVLVYSVYAHLGPGGPLPAEGAWVRAGEPIGRVGRSGRASTDHLHFEVRRAADPGERWEKTEALDPVAFVRARLPAVSPDGWAVPWLVWGAAGDLYADGTDPAAPLARSAWWRMLARCALDGPETLPATPAGLRDTLIARGLLPEDAAGTKDRALGWDELARDLDHLRAAGVRMAPGPATAEAQRAACDRELGEARPARHPHHLARRDGAPTLAHALLALADLAPADDPR